MTTALKDFPRTPLPQTRHQQMRQMLLQEARRSTARKATVRWVMPVAVGAVAAATVGAVAIAGPSHVFAGDAASGGDASVNAAPTCRTGDTYGSVDDPRADALRLLAQPPGGMALEQSWVNQHATGCNGSQTPVLTMARTATGGALEAAVTVWEQATAPSEEADLDEVTLRGEPGLALTGSDHVDLWWSEDGRDLRVSASGVDQDDVVTALDSLVLDGTVTWPEAPGGVSVLGGWEREPVRAVEPLWYAAWAAPTSTPGVDGDGSSQQLSLTVSRTDVPWQASVSTVAPRGRVVEVDGVPAHLGDNGVASVRILRWSPAPGVQAFLMGSAGSTPGGLVAYGESLAPVPSDDPRITEPEYVSDPSPTSTVTPDPRGAATATPGPAVP